MKKLILGLALCFSLACVRPSMAQTAPTLPAPTDIHIDDVFVRQVALINQVNEAFPDVDIQIARKHCGEENSYYYDADLAEKEGWTKPRIVLCDDMDVNPDAALMFAAHEMGHAVSDYYTDTKDEQNADELGALFMIQFGHVKELIGAVKYYASQEDQGHSPGDDHPSNGYRAWFLGCLALGATATGPKICKELLETENFKWQRRLNDPVETLDLTIDDLFDVLKNPFKPLKF